MAMLAMASALKGKKKRGGKSTKRGRRGKGHKVGRRKKKH
jgi:hypothetical protein